MNNVMKYKGNIHGLVMRLSAAALLMPAVAGCTSDFEKWNTNPNEATEDMLDWDNARTGSLFLQMEQNVLVVAQPGADIGTDRYQTVEVMGGDNFINYFGSSNSNHNSAGRYNWAQNSYYGDMFTTNYTRTMNAWRSLKQYIDNENDPRYALTQIIKVAAMHRVTDTYGPIPYIDFGVKSEVAYNSQKDVYYKFFEELTAAVEILVPYANDNQTLFAEYDCVYRGNIAAWVKFANTLRLRLAMHLANVDPSKAKAEAEAAVSASGGLMTLASEVAQLQHISPLETYESPLYLLAMSWKDIRMGATLETYMNGYSDPRRDAWFYAAADGSFRGIRSGLANGISKDSYVPEAAGSTTGTYFSVPKVTQTSDVVWMRASETYFLMAEGALRGWNMGGTAESFYRKGVEVSFEECGVSGAAAYLSSTSTPASYSDPVRTGYSAAAPSTIDVAWKEDGKQLERIITQKYIALYPVGQEAWTEYRRTGFPKVLPPCVNESNGGSVSNGDIIRRLPFPQNEYNTNMDELNKGISLLGGPDTPGTRLWFDTGSNNI